jgi:N-acetylglutamate synthase-like GNAT family acetyltransferase
VHIRRATESDATAIKSLIDRYVPSGTLLPRTEAFIMEHAHNFTVAVDRVGGQMIGCVHLDEYAPSLAEIRSLAVEPARHGTGVGSALVVAAEDLARMRGYATLFAVSNDESFFLRCGYEARHIPELDVERSEVSRFKGVYAKDVPGDTGPRQGAAAAAAAAATAAKARR